MKKKEKKPEKEEIFDEDEDGEMNYKASSQFSKHMAKPSNKASDFSKHKTMKQQREYLPIYGCREQLMQVIAAASQLHFTCGMPAAAAAHMGRVIVPLPQVIRDNPVVIIVGETGSGKTTQMTQYLMEEVVT